MPPFSTVYHMSAWMSSAALYYFFARQKKTEPRMRTPDRINHGDTEPSKSTERVLVHPFRSHFQRPLMPSSPSRATSTKDGQRLVLRLRHAAEEPAHLGVDGLETLAELGEAWR